jgi:hypothetical protein
MADRPATWTCDMCPATGPVAPRGSIRTRCKRCYGATYQSTYRSAKQGKPPRRSGYTKPLTSPGERLAQSATSQRIGIELARCGLRTALAGMSSLARLEAAVKVALADLDDAVEPPSSPPAVISLVPPQQSLVST